MAEEMTNRKEANHENTTEMSSSAPSPGQAHANARPTRDLVKYHRIEQGLELEELR